MKRNDLYGLVHKGLRAELFEATADVARADFSSEVETRTAAARWRRLIEFLDEHARHEDHRVAPLIAAASPELAQALEREHAQVDGSLRATEALLVELERANNGSRAAIGLELQRQTERLLAEQLHHMQREETQVNAALWSRFTDAELAVAHQAILADIAPPRMAEWIALFLPALNEAERAGLLADLHASAPREVFDALTRKACERLGPQAWARVCKRAAISPAPAALANAR